jgi:hypothetical protein
MNAAGGHQGQGAGVAPGPIRRNSLKFEKLERTTLIKILRHYGMTPNPAMSAKELAASVTNCFEGKKLQQDNLSENDVCNQIVSVFLEKCTKTNVDSNAGAKKTIPVGRPSLTSANTNVQRELAKVGEQVAAKDPTKTDNDDGSWILASILEINHQHGFYVVQDEDDMVRVGLKLAFRDVRKLEDSGAYLNKGDPVLAVFPDTTSFYRAVVAKALKIPNSSVAFEVVVRFDDDEDESGRSPLRKVPARFVIKRSDVE